LAAISKEVRVRVLGSWKKLTTVFPLRVGTFFMSRKEISLRDSAVVRMVSISSRVNPFIPVRWWRLKGIAEPPGVKKNPLKPDGRGGGRFRDNVPGHFVSFAAENL
jgi:hypothetical protein